MVAFELFLNIFLNSGSYKSAKWAGFFSFHQNSKLNPTYLSCHFLLFYFF